MLRGRRFLVVAVGVPIVALAALAGAKSWGVPGRSADVHGHHDPAHLQGESEATPRPFTDEEVARIREEARQEPDRFVCIYQREGRVEELEVDRFPGQTPFPRAPYQMGCENPY